MVRPCIYIDFDFFRFISKEIQYKQNNFVKSERIKLIDKIIDFILGENMHIIINASSLNNFDPHEDLMTSLIKSHTQGEIKLEKMNQQEFDDAIKKIGENSPFSICLIPEVNKLQQDQIEEAGFYCVCSANFENFLSMPFLKKNSFNVAKDGDIASWQDFSKLSHEFNTILISDSYLFVKEPKKFRSIYNETISEIVANLLINNKSKVIHILIVFPKLKPHQDFQDKISVLKNEIESSLKDKLDVTKKDIRIGLAVIRSKTSINHDRMIFTNFMVLYSGDSFNYFRKDQKPDIETVLQSFSIFDWESNFQTYLNKLQKLKKVIPENDKIGTEVCRVGHCDIELLKAII